MHYAQSPAQLARLIWTLHIRPGLNRERVAPEFRALDLAYWRHRRLHRDAEFVAKFRAEHPQEYLELFA